MPYRRRGVRSWRWACLAVLLVGVSSWFRGVIRSSCGVAVCLPSSFACRLVRFSSLRLVWRLVAHSPCPAGSGGAACLLISSWSYCSRGAWLVVVLGHLVVLVPSHLIVLLVPSGEAFILVSGSVSLWGHRRWFARCGGVACLRFPWFRFVSRLVERGRFGFSFHPGGSGWAAVPVLPSWGRCLLAPASSGDVAMPFSPAPYHPMAAGYGLRAVSSIVFVVCFLFPGAIVIISFCLPG